MSSMTMLSRLPLERRVIQVFRKADRRHVKSLPCIEANIYEAAKMGRANEVEVSIRQGIYTVYRFTAADVMALQSDDRDTRRAAARKASDFLLKNYPERRA